MLAVWCHTITLSAFFMAFSSSDLSAVNSAIITLATRDATRVEIDGRVVEYRRSDIPHLLRLKSAIENDIAKASDSGGIELVKPMGREA